MDDTVVPYYGDEYDMKLVESVIKSSFAKINVYAETMTVHSIYESAKYDVSATRTIINLSAYIRKPDDKLSQRAPYYNL